MKPYVDLNTRLRAQAKNKFERVFFRKASNAVYGKAMENLRKHVDVKLVTSEKQARRWINKTNFSNFTISKNLTLCHMKKTKIKFYKPYPVGTCVLDLAKLHMYVMLYRYIKLKWGDKVEVVMTDTDSFVLMIETEDDYKDVVNDILQWFDTRNYPKDHPIYTDVNKKVISKFKDEAGGMQIAEFAGLNAKNYSILMNEGGEIKKCKGVKRAVVKKTLHHEDFKNCVLKKEDQ